LNTGAGQIIVGINDGTGTFSDILQFRQFVATAGATNIVNGDFNNDGFDDLAYVDYNSNFAAVVLNDSTDFFLTPHFRETGGFVPVSAAVADVNDDDNLDLVVVNTGASPNTSNQSIVSVLDGDGEGNLVPTGALLQVPNFGISIVGGLQDIEDGGDGTGVTRRVVDFNNDGYPDFAVASTRGANNPNGFFGNQPAATVSLILNRADSPGNFVVQPPIGLIDDTNGAQQFGSLSLESTFGGPGLVTGRGGENPPFGLTGIGVGGANYVMAVGDFNADGSPDLVVTGTENDLATALITGVLAFVPYRSSIFLIGNETDGSVRVSRPQRTASYASNPAVGLNLLNDAGDTFVACAVGNFLPAPNNVPDVFHLSINGNIYVDQNVSSILNHAPILTIERDVEVKNQNLNAPFPGGGRKEIITAGEAATVPITGFDADGDDLAFSLVSPPNGQAAPSFVTVMKTGRQSAEVDIEQGAATNPGPGPAVYRIAVEASDKASVGGSGNRLPLTGRTYFTLVVNPATPPEIGAIAPISIEAGKSETINLSITQAQGFAVQTSVSCDKGNFVSVNGTTLSVSPALSDVGTSTCTLTATNMMKNVNGEIVGGLSSTASFTVTVTEPNLPPTISSIQNQTVQQGMTASVAVSASDPNGNTGLKLSLTQAPAFVSLSDNGNGTGTIRIAPTLVDTTGGMVTVQVTDPGGLSAQTSFMIAVEKVVSIMAASFDTAGKQLFISGSGFGSSGASVSINGKDVSTRISGQSDRSITVKGNKKKLNLKSGPNVITVTAGGTTSAPFTLNLLSAEE
jgi:hypothetical protein